MSGHGVIKEELPWVSGVITTKASKTAASQDFWDYNTEYGSVMTDSIYWPINLQCFNVVDLGYLAMVTS